MLHAYGQLPSGNIELSGKVDFATYIKAFYVQALHKVKKVVNYLLCRRSDYAELTAYRIHPSPYSCCSVAEVITQSSHHIESIHHCIRVPPILARQASSNLSLQLRGMSLWKLEEISILASAAGGIFFKCAEVSLSVLRHGCLSI